MDLEAEQLALEGKTLRPTKKNESKMTTGGGHDSLMARANKAGEEVKDKDKQGLNDEELLRELQVCGEGGKWEYKMRSGGINLLLQVHQSSMLLLPL